MRSKSRALRALTLLVGAAVLASILSAPADLTPATHAAEALSAYTDRLIVTLGPAGEASLQRAAGPAEVATQLSSNAGADLAYVHALDASAHVFALPTPRAYADVAAIARRLTAAPEVRSAEPDLMVFPTREPSDVGYRNFGWHLKPVGYLDGIGAVSYGANLPPAWEITTGSPSVVTAIVDTGALLNHEDLAGRARASNPGYDMIGDVARANDGDGRDPDPSDPGDYVTPAEAGPGCPSYDSTWHGSHVAGTIGARANNGKGMAGIVWDAPLLHIRALGKCGGYISDIADGVRWAAGLSVPGLPVNPNPARVINLSLGGGGSCSSYFQNAVYDVVNRGAVVVVAAGNENRDATLSTPGNCADVITVAATSQFGDRARYSNYGASVEIAAPGGDGARDSMIYSTLNTGYYGPERDSYGFYEGTSMATPHVAGIVALMLSANPSLGPAEVLSILQSTATPFPYGSSCGGSCGAGIVNGGAAVEEAARRARTASFQAADTRAGEGDTLSIPVSLSIASNQPVVVPFSLTGSAGSADHSLTAGSLTFAPGATTASLNLTIADDTLAEGDETLTIHLNPGDRSGLGALASHTVTIVDDDARPMMRLTPTSLGFGEVRVGQESAAHSVTVANVGDLPLTISGLALSADYSRSGGSCPASFPATLARGASCTIGVTFTPTRAGTRNGSLTVSSDEADARAVALGGVGTTPALGFGPTSLHFADQIVSAASPTATVTLTNPGTAPLLISGVEASGDYRVGEASCSSSWPATLAPGASCDVAVGFTPRAGGHRVGALTVAGDVPGGPYSIRLRGNGLLPELAVDAASLNFGGQEAGAGARTRVVTLGNRGGAPLTLSGVGVGGAAFARVGGSCPTGFPATLAAGETCTVQIGFTPDLVQPYAGSLTITSDDPGGIAGVALAGIGTAAPAASPQLSPAALSFSDQLLPASGGEQAVTLTNQGAAPMTISEVALGGAGFSRTGGSCATALELAPGASCTVGVRLAGRAPGAYDGTLTVGSDAPGGPQTATLAGEVVAGPGMFSLAAITLASTPYSVTLRFTIGRAAPTDGAASIDYGVIADRQTTNGDLVVAVGNVAFTPGEREREIVVTLDRLALYGATSLVVNLEDPEGRSGPDPRASSNVALPPADYLLYAPLIGR